MADNSDPQDIQFPVPFQAFKRTLKGGSDEIWTKLLQQRYGRENHTPKEWKSIIDQLRDQPAHGVN